MVSALTLKAASNNGRPAVRQEDSGEEIWGNLENREVDGGKEMMNSHI